jgi:hypothetical protein
MHLLHAFFCSRYCSCLPALPPGAWRGRLHTPSFGPSSPGCAQKTCTSSYSDGHFLHHLRLLGRSHGAVSPPDQKSGSLNLRGGSRHTYALAKPLAHTRPSHIAGQMVLLAETSLPFRLLKVFQYSTNLCESGTHPFPQGLLIL